MQKDKNRECYDCKLYDDHQNAQQNSLLVKLVLISLHQVSPLLVDFGTKLAQNTLAKTLTMFLYAKPESVVLKFYNFFNYCYKDGNSYDAI